MKSREKEKPRDKDGKFIKYSKLGSKTVSTRFYKDDQELLIEVAESEGLTPVELTREIIHAWANSLRASKNIA